MWPNLGDLDLNLRAPANISRTDKAKSSKFSTQIDCKEYKIRRGMLAPQVGPS